MAQVTITLSDTDTESGRYHATFEIEHSKVADGQFTSAHLAGAFLMSQFATPAFEQRVKDHCDRFEVSPMGASNDSAATIKLVLTDENLDMGFFTRQMDVDQVEPANTGAILVAHFVWDWMTSKDYADAQWRFAETLTEKNAGSRIANADLRPAADAANDEVPTSGDLVSQNA